MPFSLRRTPSLPSLLIGALLLGPAAARAGGGFDAEAQAAFLDSLAPDPEAAAKAHARDAFVRNLARRLEDRANEKLLLSVPRDKSSGPAVLAAVGEAVPDPPKVSFREHFRLSLRRGLEYRHKVDLGDQRLSMKLWGPIVGSKPGLGFAVDSVVEAHRVQMKAYGSMEKAGLQIELEF